jgi:hypothetical protein
VIDRIDRNVQRGGKLADERWLDERGEKEEEE